jgi:hypothetical protein
MSRRLFYLLYPLSLAKNPETVKDLGPQEWAESGDERNKFRW